MRQLTNGAIRTLCFLTAVAARLVAAPMYSIANISPLGPGLTIGYGINGSGEIAGQEAVGALTHAFLYDRTTIHDLGTLGGGNQSVGEGINASGEVTGYSNKSGNVAHAFLYDGPTMHDLGTLGGDQGSGSGINASGEVSGTSFTSGDAASHAFLYDGTTMHDLGTLGGSSSQADGLNDVGEVVGISGTQTSLHAFVYDGTTMYDLNNLLSNPLSGIQLTEATAINNLGQIIAYGLDANCGGAVCTYLLTPERQNPTPEPRFYGIILCGLLGAIGSRYRHRLP